MSRRKSNRMRMSKSRRYGGENPAFFNEKHTDITTSVKNLTQYAKNLPRKNVWLNRDKERIKNYVKKISISENDDSFRIIPENKIKTIPLYEKTSKIIENIEKTLLSQKGHSFEKGTYNAELDRIIKDLTWKNRIAIFHCSISGGLAYDSFSKHELLEDLIPNLKSINNRPPLIDPATDIADAYKKLQNSNKSYAYLFNAHKVNDQINNINKCIVEYNNGYRVE